MGLFGKSAQQKRIDSDALVIAELRKEVAKTGALLTRANEHMGWADNQTRAAIHERDAARIERDTAQRERDGYRIDAIKFRALKSNLIPGGPKAKAKRDAAAVGAGL